MKAAILVAVVAVAPLLSAPTATADPRCGRGGCVDALPTESGFAIGGIVGGSAGGAEGGGSGGGGGGATGPLYTYAYVPACSSNGPPPEGSEGLCLGATTTCPDGGVRMWVFRREVDRTTRVPTTGWRRLDGTICVDGLDEAGVPAITRIPALVRQEWRNAQLRRSGVRFTPRDGGIVNLETIFHADTPRTFAVPIGPILGYDVAITATATEYRWEWGDGTSSTTTTPGAPYPSREVTHVYRDRGSYPVRVTVTYAGTFTVDDGEPQPIDGTVSVAGPATTVPVREARAQLIDAEGDDSAD